MPLKDIIKPFYWSQYSKKVALRIETPYCLGRFSKQEAQERSLHFAKAVLNSIEEEYALELTWLVDPEDGVVVDARFLAFANSALIAALEASRELVIGKNYDQCKRLTAELI